jgi:hypothetical protein
VIEAPCKESENMPLQEEDGHDGCGSESEPSAKTTQSECSDSSSQLSGSMDVLSSVSLCPVLVAKGDKKKSKKMRISQSTHLLFQISSLA